MASQLRGTAFSISTGIALLALLLLLPAVPSRAQTVIGGGSGNCSGSGPNPSCSSFGRCAVEINKNYAKVAKRQGKQICRCIKDAAKSKLVQPSIEDCTTDDPKGKISGAQAKLLAKEIDRCPTDPNDAGFPFFAYTSGANANQTAVDIELSLIHGIFGSNLDAAIIVQDKAVAGSKEASKCQIDMAKTAKKCFDTRLKVFNKCKKNGMKGKTPPGQLLSAADLDRRCLQLDPNDPTVGGQPDPKIKIDKKCITKLNAKFTKRCGGVDLQAAFPGLDPNADVPTQLDRLVACEMCLGLVDVDDLDRDCDLFDDGISNASCGLPSLAHETIDIPSSAQPAETPGSPGVGISNPDLAIQLGDPNFDLNNARYTRVYLPSPPSSPPEAILILVPGFEGGAGSLNILGENLVQRAIDQEGRVIEVWNFDRRSNQLEDAIGLDLAEAQADPNIALDWLFGGEMGLTLHAELVAGPNRRAIFHNTSDDIPFLANWTQGVFSQDIDAVVELARATALNSNVYLGGHSAGTGFTARYAATNFNFDPNGAPDPGYAKLRGLVLLEGGGGSTAAAAPSAATLDAIEDRFDGGLFNAVSSGVASCTDGTVCDPNNPVACSGKGNGTCVEPTGAYAVVAGLLNARILSAGEVTAIQSINDPDEGLNLVGVDKTGVDTSAIDLVPELASLSFIPDSTAYAGLGAFVDDDGVIASFVAPFVASSVGLEDPNLNAAGLVQWRDITEAVPAAAFTDNGPAPTSLPAGNWGVEVEPVRMDRFTETFYKGGTNFVDLYYPSSGLSVTDGLPGLDSSALSIGRGRNDIVNITEAADIDIPVIAFGGSNGLTEVPGSFVAFGQSIGLCTALSCDGSTARVVDPNTPNQAFPTLGDVDGGYEVHISEGYAHVDVVVAEDDATNNVVGPLLDFILRNNQ